MEIHAIAFCLGAILLLVGIVGGGFGVKEVKVPQVGKNIRLIAGGVGLFFIFFGIGLRVEPPGSAPIPEPAASNEPERLKQVNGQWSVSWRNNESCATIVITNGVGVFTTSYITEVEEELTSQSDSRGLLLFGLNPVFRYSRTPFPRYNPDSILIERLDNGNYRISLRNENEWKSIAITKQNIVSDGLDNLVGEWNFRFQGYDAFLEVNKGEGVYIRQTPVEITQLLRGNVTTEGIHFVGYDVVVKGTSIHPPFYAPDQFLFVQQPGSPYGYELKVWDSVIMKDRQSLSILSHQPD